jgi:hypothetical protein
MEVHFADWPEDPLIQCRSCRAIYRTLYDQMAWAARYGWMAGPDQRRAIGILKYNDCPWYKDYKQERKRRVEKVILAMSDYVAIPIKVVNWDLSARTPIDDGKIP